MRDEDGLKAALEEIDSLEKTTLDRTVYQRWNEYFPLFLLPGAFLVLIAVSLFKESGLAALLAKAATPFFRLIGIPPELTELIVVRPMSGSGSIGLLNEVYLTYGADSYPARAASVIVGSSETVFYVAALYGGGRIKKYRGAIGISLFATFAGTVISCLLCRLL